METSTLAAGVGNQSPPIETFHTGGEKADKKTGTGPAAVYGSKVIMIFRRKLRNGRVIGYSSPEDRVALTAWIPTPCTSE